MQHRQHNLIDLGENLGEVIGKQIQVQAFTVMKVETRQGRATGQVKMFAQWPGKETL